MKSIIKKSVLFALLLVNLSFTTQIAFAESHEEGTGSAEDLSPIHSTLDKAKDKENVCIKDDGDDSSYIITIIEEPLDVKDNEKAADFKYRKCYRHSFTFVDDEGKATNLNEISNKNLPCMESAETTAKEVNSGKFDGIKSANYFCKEVQVILSKGGTSMIYGYIGMLYKWGASLAGVIAVTIIIMSGIQISAAGGDPEAVGSAKKRILKSIAGIVVLFLSGLILYTVNPNFFVTS